MAIVQTLEGAMLLSLTLLFGFRHSHLELRSVDVNGDGIQSQCVYVRWSAYPTYPIYG